jgi:hypothetical protein
MKKRDGIQSSVMAQRYYLLSFSTALTLQSDEKIGFVGRKR